MRAVNSLASEMVLIWDLILTPSLLLPIMQALFFHWRTSINYREYWSLEIALHCTVNWSENIHLNLTLASEWYTTGSTVFTWLPSITGSGFWRQEATLLQYPSSTILQKFPPVIFKYFLRAILKHLSPDMQMPKNAINMQPKFFDLKTYGKMF